jgi:hypothetical protein
MAGCAAQLNRFDNIVEQPPRVVDSTRRSNRRLEKQRQVPYNQSCEP